MKKVELNDGVIVYDRYRFAIPLDGVVVKKSESNDGVEVRLLKSNNKDYPVGCTVWVSRRQLRRRQ